MLTQATAPLNQRSCSPQKFSIIQAHISQSAMFATSNEASN